MTINYLGENRAMHYLRSMLSRIWILRLRFISRIGVACGLGWLRSCRTAALWLETVWRMARELREKVFWLERNNARADLNETLQEYCDICCPSSSHPETMRPYCVVQFWRHQWDNVKRESICAINLTMLRYIFAMFSTGMYLKRHFSAVSSK